MSRSCQILLFVIGLVVCPTSLAMPDPGQRPEQEFKRGLCPAYPTIDVSKIKGEKALITLFEWDT